MDCISCVGFCIRGKVLDAREVINDVGSQLRKKSRGRSLLEATIPVFYPKHCRVTQEWIKVPYHNDSAL
jgi:hypothetical protein